MHISAKRSCRINGGCADPAPKPEESRVSLQAIDDHLLFIIRHVVWFPRCGFIGAANLTYRPIAALRENHGAGEEYRAAIDELGCYQAGLMRVSYLGRNKSVPRDTFDAASHMVMQRIEMIRSYLDQTKKYDQKLGKAESLGFKSPKPLD